jgi:hypothetical protein
VFTAQCYAAYWCNTRPEVRSWPPLSSSFREEDLDLSDSTPLESAYRKAWGKEMTVGTWVYTCMAGSRYHCWEIPRVAGQLLACGLPALAVARHTKPAVSRGEPLSRDVTAEDPLLWCWRMLLVLLAAGVCSPLHEEGVRLPVGAGSVLHAEPVLGLWRDLGALQGQAYQQVIHVRYRLTRNVFFFVTALHVSVLRPSPSVCSYTRVCFMLDWNG